MQRGVKTLLLTRARNAPFPVVAKIPEIAKDCDFIRIYELSHPPKTAEHEISA
jgi:hypothetical protein